jgi:hypothetical protein
MVRYPNVSFTIPSHGVRIYRHWRSRLASLRGGCEANHGRDVGKLHLRPEAEGLQKQTDKSVRRVYVVS